MTMTRRLLLIIALLLPGRASGPSDPFEDIPHGQEYPREPEEVDRWVSARNVTAMRSHAWYLFDQLTHQSHGGLPRWLTWYQWGDDLERREPARDLVLFKPFALTSEDRDSPHLKDTTTLYNRSAYQTIINRCLGSPEKLALYAKCPGRNIPSFKEDAVAIKVKFIDVNPSGCTEVPVWDFRKTPGATKFVEWPRKVKVGDSASCEVPLSRFYRAKFDGTVHILVGFHVATREIENWVWATFWWHDAPTQGPFAEGRPRHMAEPWNQFLMNVSYSMDEPPETDGSPHIAYNPYLEGTLFDGTKSNCMSCHRRAALLVKTVKTKEVVALEPDHRILLSYGDIRTESPGRTVVRGSESAVTSYFNQPFEEMLKLSFLWSLAADHKGERVLPKPAKESDCSCGK